MPEPKTYVPKCSAKMVTFQDGGELLKLSFKVDELIAFLTANKNEKGWINFGVSKRREPSQYGDTHSVWLDTWKPTKQDGPPQPTTIDPADVPQIDDSQVPF